MLLKEIIKEAVNIQKLELKKSNLGTKRNLLKQIDIRSEQIIIISGIRRCGKSTLLKQITSNLKNYNYFNFEDQRVFGFELHDFNKLEEVFNEKVKNRIYFFDEIQNVSNWERFIRTQQDKSYKFFLTGSNASLLSRELGTKLTGRHLTYELFPFSYDEFLKLKRYKAGIKSFEKYFDLGGFPEYIKTQNIQILQQVFEDILIRDIIVRYKLRNSRTIKELAVYLISNASKEYSYNKLKNIFGLGSASSAISYISYFEDSFLMFSVPRFSYSLKQQVKNPKKIYVIDVGFARANSLSFSKDEGRILENVVFLQLRRNYKNIFYFREKYECDFVIKKRNTITSAYQVCYRITEENKDREINGILEALNYFNLKKGIILTFDQKDEFTIRGKKILIIPTWEWMS